MRLCYAATEAGQGGPRGVSAGWHGERAARAVAARGILRVYGTLIALLVLIAVFALAIPNFATAANA